MKRILVVEDDTNAQKIYTAKLGDQYLLDITADGDQALDYLNRNVYQLVILDVMLTSHINGFDILEKMKHDDKLKQIPVIVLTNLDNQEKTALEIGANDYMVKSNTSIAEIASKVNSYLNDQ